MGGLKQIWRSNHFFRNKKNVVGKRKGSVKEYICWQDGKRTKHCPGKSKKVKYTLQERRQVEKAQERQMFGVWDIQSSIFFPNMSLRKFVSVTDTWCD